MMRRGWTLQEMLISLILTGGIVAIAAQLALGQLRYFQGIGALIGVRGQIAQTSSIIARALWSASPAAGDITIALDSAIEFQAAIGSAIVCDSHPGLLVVPPPSSQNSNVLSAFWDTPSPGDQVHAFLDDSLGATWLAFHVLDPPRPGAACVPFGDTRPSWLISLREPIAVPKGTTLRFTRPARLSLYRSSDGRWYLGAKEWNNEAQHFNAVQPIAGPLRPYSENPSESGLHLRYHDASGAQLESPTDLARIASVSLTARAETNVALKVSGLATTRSGTYADSVSITIALRNAQ